MIEMSEGNRAQKQLHHENLMHVVRYCENVQDCRVRVLRERERKRERRRTVDRWRMLQKSGILKGFSKQVGNFVSLAFSLPNFSSCSYSSCSYSSCFILSGCSSCGTLAKNSMLRSAAVCAMCARCVVFRRAFVVVFLRLSDPPSPPPPLFRSLSLFEHYPVLLPILIRHTGGSVLCRAGRHRRCN